MNLHVYKGLLTSSNSYLRIDCYFRAHMEYKRPDGGLKIP